MHAIVNAKQREILDLPIEAIRSNPYQPRKHFDKIAIGELANSIREFGVIQPITVRRLRPGAYELVAGERRLRACAQIKMETIPAVIVDITDDDSAIIALIENLQRKDLNFIEEAEGYYHLINEHGMTQEELAVKIGKNQSTIANKIRLLKLSPCVRRLLLENGLTERHGRALLKLPDEDSQLRILKHIVDKKLNVLSTEELVEREISKILGLKQSLAVSRMISKGKRDFRIFLNTINQALELVKNAGVPTSTRKVEGDTYFEYIIRIEK